MAKSIAAPTKYYQGSLLLSDFYRYVSHIGRSFVIICDDRARSLVEDRISEGFKNSGSQCTYLKFNGESSFVEARRLAEITTETGCSGVIGVGGGKAIDTAKLVGDICGLPIVLAPTSASTAASCTCLSMVYTVDGRFDKVQRMKEGPEVVLVDTDIISKAPSALLVSGMGNALATYYESRACERSGVQNYMGGSRTNSTMELVRLCRDLILKNGAKAKEDADAKKVTKAVEAVVEANVYISGIGYENNGCAAAQGIYQGLTVAVDPISFSNGEGTAYGLLVQLIMEYVEAGNWDDNEWKQIVNFYKSVGLPLKLSDLQIKDFDETLIHGISKAACMPNSNMHNMPFEVTEDKVCFALCKLEGMDI